MDDKSQAETPQRRQAVTEWVSIAFCLGVAGGWWWFRPDWTAGQSALAGIAALAVLLVYQRARSG